MRRTGTRLGPAISGMLALAVVAAFMLMLKGAAAQSPDRVPQPGHWDRWNPNWMQRDTWGPGRMETGMRQRMARHWTFMHRGIPGAYIGATNPLAPDSDTIGAGRALYREKCASCHGATGMGDGEVANSLSPSPALLAYLIQMPNSVDEYMIWSISDGGAAFGTKMPAYKNVLTKDQIWQIVTYMRAGFPAEQVQQ